MTEPQQVLDPRITIAWRFKRLFRFALVSIPSALIIVALASTFWTLRGGITISAIYLVQGLIYALIWPSLEYRYFRYEVREKDLLVQQGVLFRRISAIPRHRIQHVDTRQGPFERLLGLASLQLYTASGVSADGSIPGLAAETAEQLRDELSHRGGDDGV